MQIKGVLCIHGTGLFTLTKRLAKRHLAYKRFIARIHRLIAGMPKAVKEERKKRSKVEQATLGYDPEKWVKTNDICRSEDPEADAYHELSLPPPVKGRQKFSFC